MNLGSLEAIRPAKREVNADSQALDTNPRLLNPRNRQILTMGVYTKLADGIDEVDIIIAGGKTSLPTLSHIDQRELNSIAFY